MFFKHFGIPGTRPFRQKETVPKANNRHLHPPPHLECDLSTNSIHCAGITIKSFYKPNQTRKMIFFFLIYFICSNFTAIITFCVHQFFARRMLQCRVVAAVFWHELIWSSLHNSQQIGPNSLLQENWLTLKHCSL